ncbi:MAG: hypothetical protein L3J79_04070 [Candidatus Marinimicrobia bacterium]|nr:hypothetical protein [Candidatus Neomarinimicrobiota bacterium]
MPRNATQPAIMGIKDYVFLDLEGKSGPQAKPTPARIQSILMSLEKFEQHTASKELDRKKDSHDKQ